LRKNLGAKNCEFAPGHIKEILNVYVGFEAIERKSEEGIASQIFDNSAFGYYKVTIERPKRLKAQFTKERIAELRFDKTLREPMVWAYEQFGEKLYINLSKYEKDILDWCEKNELNLNTKQSKALVDSKTWQKQIELLDKAKELMKIIGTDEYNDFNIFKEKVDAEVKSSKLKLSDAEKNSILNVVSWYDAEAVKVIKRTTKLSGKKLDELLAHLNCTVKQLPDYGYYTTTKKDEYLEYETESDIRDYESVPLKENIYEYFLREVKPHVNESWINLDATKIGYEISFNKYFYRHKPLRSLKEVSDDILKLESESEGLINEILKLT
jgi:type I restriction enzyme M protein